YSEVHLFAKLFPKSSRKVLLPSAKFEDAEHHGNKPVLTQPMNSDKLHEPSQRRNGFSQGTDANIALPLSREITLFGLELVVFKGEESELRSIFIAISCPFEDNHVLGLGAGRGPHDPFHLRLG